jgi:hypothetical protein
MDALRLLFTYASEILTSEEQEEEEEEEEGEEEKEEEEEEEGETNIFNWQQFLFSVISTLL